MVVLSQKLGLHQICSLVMSFKSYGESIWRLHFGFFFIGGGEEYGIVFRHRDDYGSVPEERKGSSCTIFA